jgi:hypothetical protein
MANGDTLTTAYTDRQTIKKHLTQRDIRQAEEFLEDITDGRALSQWDKQTEQINEAVRQQSISEFAEDFTVTDVMCAVSEGEDLNEHLGD